MESTNETSIHLWSTSRKNKNRPSKDMLLKTIFWYTNTPIDLRLLNIDELITLATWLESPSAVTTTPPDSKTKKPLVEYIQSICPKIVNGGRLPVPALQKLCGVMYDHANKK